MVIHKRFGMPLLALVLSFVFLSVLRAQEPGPGYKSGMTALNNVSILATPQAAEDLGLTPEQSDQIRKLQMDLFASSGEKMKPLQGASPEEVSKQMEPIGREIAAHAKTRLTEILNPEQFKRYKQISLQMAGYAAFLDAEVQATLKLDDEQKTKIQEIQSHFSSKVREISKTAREDRNTASVQIRELMDQLKTEIVGFLNVDQKIAWGEMVGKEFKLSHPGGSDAPRKPQAP